MFRIGIICISIFLGYQANCQVNLAYQSNLQFDVRSSDIWGWESADGERYAIMGLLNGTTIVNITDPSLPVETAFIEGPSSIWRDIKVWNNHAYVTNETADGLLIIDLEDLPGFPDTLTYRGVGTDTLRTAHNIFIDEQGIAYLAGSNIGVGGAYILDVNANPKAPEFLGLYNDHYCHDVFVRNDTLWTAEIYAGQFSVIDISDKGNPVVLASQPTPAAFTHNLWVSDDGQYVFTTDEISGAPVAAYQVSDLSDITLTDTYESSPGFGVIPHNTFYRGGFLFTSYYRDGVTVVDAHKPDNLVETGNFDTSPFPSANGFNGCWGVYPYFSDSTVAASDIEEGLFVLKPTYQRASYLEGNVIDENTGGPANGALIEILTTEQAVLTAFDGSFKTGTALPGMYDVRVTKAGCVTSWYPGIELETGLVYTLNATLLCTAVAIVPDQVNGSSFNILPAVFNESVQVAWNNTEPGALLWVSDLQGRLIYKQPLESAQGLAIIGQTWSPGTYLLGVQQENHYLKPQRIQKF